MYLGLPQVIWLMLACLDLTVALTRDGEPKGKYSFGGSFIGTAIMFWILSAGGFFG